MPNDASRPARPPRPSVTSSPLGRLARLGGLAGRVGASVLGDSLLERGRSVEGREERRRASLVENARRIVETLGELKGAAMKVGQMLSLHEGLLPPEMAAVLRSLQQSAPPVPFEVIRYEIEAELGPLEGIFDSLDPEPLAAASIGQVHRGRLRDRRRVAVKVQYPLMQEIVQADLANLRGVLGRLFALVSKADFEPVWREVRDRLLEEIDYRQEAANVERMAALLAEVDEVVVPRVVEHASASRVLTLEERRGLSPELACSPDSPQELRDRWGEVLFDLTMRGLLEHRLLHADPNFANFAFLEDGRVIVYDFGCLKEVPEPIARGYARLFGAVIDRRFDRLPAALAGLGVVTARGGLVSQELVDAWATLFSRIVGDEPYTFGADRGLYDEMFSLGLGSWGEAAELQFSEDLVFIDRTLSGHLGNLGRLRATSDWRERLRRFVRRADPDAVAAG